MHACIHTHAHPLHTSRPTWDGRESRVPPRPPPRRTKGYVHHAVTLPDGCPCASAAHHYVHASGRGVRHGERWVQGDTSGPTPLQGCGQLGLLDTNPKRVGRERHPGTPRHSSGTQHAGRHGAHSRADNRHKTLFPRTMCARVSGALYFPPAPNFAAKGVLFFKSNGCMSVTVPPPPVPGARPAMQAPVLGGEDRYEKKQKVREPGRTPPPSPTPRVKGGGGGRGWLGGGVPLGGSFLTVGWLGLYAPSSKGTVDPGLGSNPPAPLQGLAWSPV
jgi:hypothetical protein